ncbi:MAG: UDP-N-acetylmuramate dehydrogenase [Bacteroidaceae bacterium]|nr:UDP-N-acetylmuramate dehydrogenase [Bacteroidaceae bacterium]
MRKRIYNTFGIEAYANDIVEYGSVAELQNIVPTLQNCQYFHVGGGSNLLFTKDYEGTILHSKILGVEDVSYEYSQSSDDVYLKVGSGMVWDDFVGYCVGNGLCGAENLSLIPGEVGASAVQNIGAYGVEAKDIIVEVECVSLTTGEKRTFTNAECQYSYRQSIFKKELKGQYAVVYVVYRLSRKFTPMLDYGNIRSQLSDGENVTPQAIRDAIINIRQTKLPDPKVTGNAGSFFMNPVVSKEKFEELYAQYSNMPYYEVEGGVKIPAGWMIEQCGWKGKALGPAAVHDRQALVLVNLGGATGADIICLCEAVRKSVKDKFGITINPEVNII